MVAFIAPACPHGPLRAFITEKGDIVWVCRPCMWQGASVRRAADAIMALNRAPMLGGLGVAPHPF